MNGGQDGVGVGVEVKMGSSGAVDVRMPKVREMSPVEGGESVIFDICADGDGGYIEVRYLGCDL